MRKLLAASVVVGTLLGTPGAVLATDHCHPAALAHRARVFAELADRGVRIAAATGAGGLAEFATRADELRFACPSATATSRVAGTNAVGGLPVR